MSLPGAGKSYLNETGGAFCLLWGKMPHKTGVKSSVLPKGSDAF